MEKLRNIKISGISITRIFAYFLIYGFIGFIIESIFGIITKGVLESRTSFINTPICGIYGLGATMMILSLQKFKNDKLKTFIVSFLVGTSIEYFISLLAEIIFHIKWWDYSDRILNINGRVCLYYSIFWGLLGLILINILNPKIDKFLDYIKNKLGVRKIKIITIVAIVLFVLDFVTTWIAIDLFTTRMIVKNNINVKNKEAIVQKYEKIYGNEVLNKIIYKLWGDKRMIKTYPNIKVQDIDGNTIYLDMYLKNIKPYFIKFYDK